MSDLRVGVLLWAVTCGAVACAAAPAPEPAPVPDESETAAEPTVGARATPPAPLPAEPLDFPGFSETTLPNGLRLIVLEDHDLPVLNVQLYVQSGSADDPVERAGLAEIVAELLTKGTATRSAEEIAETIEGVGGNLSAGASLDYTQVSASVLADRADIAFELLGDVALRPTFPDDELELVRTRTLSALRVASSDPGTLATRRFMRELYGADHPYSTAAIPETVEAIAREDVEEFHDSRFRADNAVLVVSGDIAADRAESLARQTFGDWAGGGVPEPTFVEPPARDETRIFFVHRPGSVQSNIRLGSVGIRPNDPDYYPLQVMNRILGGGTDARLFAILREEKGWTYGAYAQMTRPKDVGFLSATAEVRNEVTDSALTEMLRQLRRLREEPVPREELEAAKSFLTGSFPLRIETPSQIAAQVAQTRLLGLPTEALTEYRERVEAVTADDVLRVAREYLQPDRATVVVVGDATRVLDSLRGIAPISLYDAEGEPMEADALEVKGPTQSVEATSLEPATLVYGISVQGNSVGTVTTSLEREGDEWVTRTVGEGALSQESEARFRDDFTPVSSRQEVRQGGVTMVSELRYEDGRVTGNLALPPQLGGEQTVDAEVVAGTLLPEMDPWYLAAAELAPGTTITVPQFVVQGATTSNVTYRVTGTESVTVPAGTFETLRVEISGTPQPMTLFLRHDAPHVMVKQEYAGQPVVIELRDPAVGHQRRRPPAARMGGRFRSRRHPERTPDNRSTLRAFRIRTRPWHAIEVNDSVTRLPGPANRRNHDVGVGRAPPHHPWTPVVGLGGKGLQQTRIGDDHHDVRYAVLEPFVVGGRAGREWVHIADGHVALEHVGDSDALEVGITLVRPGVDHLSPCRVETHRRVVGNARRVGHADPPVRTLTQGVALQVHHHGPLRHGRRSRTQGVANQLRFGGHARLRQCGARKCKEQPVDTENRAAHESLQSEVTNGWSAESLQRATGVGPREHERGRPRESVQADRSAAVTGIQEDHRAAARK